MTTEENKAAYAALNHKSIKERMSQVMLNMVRRKDLSKDAGEVFDEVKRSFNQEEMAYMACCYIGLELKNNLAKNPVLVMLTQLLRLAEEAAEEQDKDKQEDLVKQVMDMFKN